MQTSSTESQRDWIQQWADRLTEPAALDDLVEDLRYRWDRNVPDETPIGLPMESFGKAGGRWWHTLELFLLDEETTGAADLAAKVIEAFRLAFEASDPEFDTGVVWINDVLALRRAINAKKEDRDKAVDLILRALDRVHGVFPYPEREAYSYVDSIYRAVCDCVVTELYEPETVDSQFAKGFRPAGFDQYTVFFLLEKQRRGLVEAEAASEAADEDADWAARLQYEADDFVTVDDAALQRYQTLLDSLHRTLLELNAQALRLSDGEDEVPEFKMMLRRVHRKGGGAVEDKARFVNLQRSLDIHWRRLAHVLSPSLRETSEEVVSFIEMMAHEDKEYSAEVRHCLLSKDSRLLNKPWRPYQDQVTSVHDAEDRTFFVPPPSSEAILAAKEGVEVEQGTAM